MQAPANRNDFSDVESKAKTSDKGGENVDTMLDFNALQYNMYPDLSVCVNRTTKNSFFQTNKYDADQKTAYCILNTGSDFIHGRNSFLVFDLQVEGLDDDQTALWGGAGSAYNLIHRITISDRAGNELERIRDVNRLVNLQLRNMFSAEFLSTVGSGFLNKQEIDKSLAQTTQRPNVELRQTGGSGEQEDVESWHSYEQAVPDPFFGYDHSKVNVQLIHYSNTELSWYNAGDEITTLYANGEMELYCGGALNEEQDIAIRSFYQPGDVITLEMSQVTADSVYFKLKGMSPMMELTITGETVYDEEKSTSAHPVYIIHTDYRNSYATWDSTTASFMGTNHIDFTDSNDKIDYDQNDDAKMNRWSKTERVEVPKLISPSEYSVGNKRWCLPLRFLSGLFDYDQLLPSMLMSGLRIEIEWARPDVAFRLTGVTRSSPATNFKYTIINPRISCDSCKLTDSVMRELNARSAKNGIEIVYRTFFTTSYTPGAGQDTIDLESRKAVSRCFGAFAAFYRNYANETERRGRDLMETMPLNAKEWQWRAGNLYFPNQVMKAPNASSSNDHHGRHIGIARETLMNTMKYYSKTHDVFKECYADVSNYTDHVCGTNKRYVTPSTTNNLTYSTGTYHYSCVASPQIGTYCCNLERSTIQDLSGIPLNNSRVLNFHWQRLDDTAEKFLPALGTRTTEDAADVINADSFDVFIFMQYLKVARVFLDNTELEE